MFIIEQLLEDGPLNVGIIGHNPIKNNHVILILYIYKAAQATSHLVSTQTPNVMTAVKT